MQPVVELRQVSKSFGATRAVDDVSLEIWGGEIFGLLGPNGAGKTTTIRMILDIFRPDRGVIRVFGAPLDEAAKRRIGYLPEERGLYKNVSVLECLVYLASLKGLSRAEARRRALAYLERVGLADVAGKKVKDLSKGMQQKVQLGVALLHDPDLLIIDEPFYGLDPVNTRLVKDLLREACARGAAIIMSTHQMDRVHELCARIAMFNQGRLVLYGALEEVRRRWAPNAVVVQGSADFARVPGVQRIESVNGAYELWLDESSDPQQVWRALAQQPAARIERFEVATPSLDDIFIAVVEGRERVERHAPQRYDEALAAAE
ncbi:ABC transporter ATP-binding protein [Kallotenue papyrolyticum]|uniref:ABC transporter ATP-binding protein n=1 Tax=Kallotenue papyrolyticum TaxID=1325125 RepID=UPI000492CA14|nr:ATP-binding cassette domain-containing protein [Kallotenue papyrolyticum]